MNNKNNEKKVLYALAIGLASIALAYFLGKQTGEYLKQSESKQTQTELNE